MVNSFTFLVSGSSLYQPVSFVISFYQLMFAAAGALFELNPQLVERVPFLKRQQVAMAVQSTQGAVRCRRAGQTLEVSFSAVSIACSSFSVIQSLHY